jgi:D-threo-aldose 1-dehydrogenase
MDAAAIVDTVSGRDRVRPRPTAVSRLAFGCGPNAGLMVSDDHELQRATVTTAFENGVTHLDTAAAYGDGKSELTVGRLIRELGITPTISSKFLITESGLDDIAGHVVRSVHESLERLGVDHVEALIMHNRVAWAREPGRVVGIGPLLSVDDVLGENGVAAAAEQLKQEGVVDTVGLTGFGGDQSAVDHLLRSGIFDWANADFSLVSPTAGMIVAPEAGAGEDYRSLIDRAASAGVRVMAIRVYGAGAMVGRSSDNPYWARLQPWLEAEGLPVVPTALRWVLDKPGVDSAVIGFSRPEHVLDAVAAVAQGPIPSQTALRLARVVASRPPTVTG